MSTCDEERIQQEYEALEAAYCPHAKLIAQGLCKEGMRHASLNRYSDLFPFDKYLVRLRSGNYINASFVALAGIEGRTIVAQGPMSPDWHGPETVSTFWEMIWDHKITTAVSMATPAPGFTGYAPWFPMNGPGSTERYGVFSVKCISEEETPQQNIRRLLRVSRTRSHEEGEREERELLQLQCVSWPNYGVPETTAPVLELLEMTRAAREERGSSMLVHCSGGVGRSGTFLAAFAGLSCTAWSSGQQRTVGSAFSLFPFVQALRLQRHSMCVEGLAQYRFAYSIVRCY